MSGKSSVERNKRDRKDFEEEDETKSCVEVFDVSGSENELKRQRKNLLDDSNKVKGERLATEGYFKLNCDDDYNSSSSDSESEVSQSQCVETIPPSFLKKIMSFPLFQDAPKNFCIEIARKLKLMIYHAHEFIVKAGEPSKAMYWILRGSVNVTSPDGEVVLAELVEGSYFGEIGILFNRPRTATVYSKTRVLVGVLTAETFNQVLSNFPLIERQIRDEAQERLAILDKQRKAGVTVMLQDKKTLRVASPPINIDSSNIYAQPLNQGMDRRYSPVQQISQRVDNSHKLMEEMMTPPQLPPIAMQSLHEVPNSNPNPAFVETIGDSISTGKFLKSLNLFATLPPDIIHKLALSVEIKQFSPFEYIFKEGDYGTDIYFIISGEIEVVGPSLTSFVSGDSKHPATKQIDIVLARLGKGQYFGEMGFLNSITASDDKDSKCIRSAGIRTVSSCNLLILTGETLREFCDKYPLVEREIKKTAEERLKKNISLNNETEIEKSIQDSQYDTVQLLESPISRKGTWKSSILNDLVKVTERENSQNLSPTSLNDPLSPSFSQSEGNLFKPEFGFSDSAKVKVPSRTTSPGNNDPMPHISPSSSVSPSNEPSSSQLRGEKDASTSSKTTVPYQMSVLAPKALELYVPPLNAPIKNRNSVFNVRSPSPMQYMSHAKRLRLWNASGGASRRRSSVLTVGPLPDRILLRCFQYLTLPELMKLSSVCRRWRQLLYVAPGLFDNLDLTPWNRYIDDKALQKVTDFVGSRPKEINITNCYHITDEGFSYMLNEIGIGGQILTLKMSSCWNISAMSIMDISVPSIGKHLREIDLSNCRKVRDDVIQRLIGWEYDERKTPTNELVETDMFGALYSLDDPIPGMENFPNPNRKKSSFQNPIGCGNLKKMILRHCKNLTDLTLYHMSLYGKDHLQYLDFARCTGLTDAGFSYWSFQPFENLKSLILSECIFLTDNTVRSIASSCPNLTVLNLSFCCSLTDASIELLCIGCRNLEFLDISFCGRAVSDVSLLHISMHLPKLQYIRLKGCLRVTRSGVDSLLCGCAPLRFIDISQCKNAHIYQGGIPAARLEPASGSKSVLLTMENRESCVEVVI